MKVIKNSKPSATKRSKARLLKSSYDSAANDFVFKVVSSESLSTFDGADALFPEGEFFDWDELKSTIKSAEEKINGFVEIRTDEIHDADSCCVRLSFNALDPDYDEDDITRDDEYISDSEVLLKVVPNAACVERIADMLY